MAARAEVMTSRSEIERWAFLRIVPSVISLIDYTKGFGHTMLIKLA